LRKDLDKPRGRVVLVNITVFFLRNDIGVPGKPLICEGPRWFGFRVQEQPRGRVVE